MHVHMSLLRSKENPSVELDFLITFHLHNASSMQIYATEDGKTRSLWEKIVGQVSILSPENYGHIDWSMYLCSLFQCIVQQYDFRNCIVALIHVNDS